MKYEATSKKVCILVDSLSYGGAERSAGLLSKALANEGFLVSIVIFIDKIDYEFSGELINLGKEFGSGFFEKLKKYRALNSLLRKENFDFVLDFRMKNFPVREFLLNVLVFNESKSLNMVRSSRLDYYFFKPFLLSKIFYSKYLGINAVSEGLKTQIEKEFNFQNVFTLPSPLDLEGISKFSEAEKVHTKPFFLSAGRMDLSDTKQFERLIIQYSELKIQQDLDLIILGEGENIAKLQELVKQKDLEGQVHLLSFQKNPFPYFKQAKFFVLSSKFEGFPRVVIEALACGTPVISFDCETGPREIIKTGYNGILVENQNFKALGEGITKMQNDANFYNICKANAAESVKEYDLPQIGSKWSSFLEKT